MKLDMKLARLAIERRLGLWKKLGNEVIYLYQNNLIDSVRLKFMNIKTEHQRDYFIELNNIGLLKRQRRLLIFIEQDKETVISKLDRRTLIKKECYKICKQNLFSQKPIYHFQKNIIHILQNDRIIQMSRNKLIRKYKGKFNQIAPENLVIRMALNCIDGNKIVESLYLRLEKIFTKAFNINSSILSKQFGIVSYQKFGNFIVLMRNYFSKYDPKVILLPNYYIGKGYKGMFYLARGEKLKQIECFDNNIYLLINQQNFFHIVKVQNNIRSFIITMLNINKCLIKPIFTKNCLIFTNQEIYQFRHVPKLFDINLKEDQII